MDFSLVSLTQNDKGFVILSVSEVSINSKRILNSVDFSLTLKMTKLLDKRLKFLLWLAL